MLAGGEYPPDLVGTTDLKLRLLEGGALLRLDDMLDTGGDYPNLAEYVKDDIKKMSYSGDEVDPGLYIFPNYNRFYGEPTGGTYYGPAFWIQKRVLEDAGYPDLSTMTLDRYFQLIADYKAKHPPQTDGAPPTVGFEVLASTGREWGGMTNPPALLSGSPEQRWRHRRRQEPRVDLRRQGRREGLLQGPQRAVRRGSRRPRVLHPDVRPVHREAGDRRRPRHARPGWDFQTATQSLQSAGKDEYTYVPSCPSTTGRSRGTPTAPS